MWSSKNAQSFLIKTLLLIVLSVGVKSIDDDDGRKLRDLPEVKSVTNGNNEFAINLLQALNRSSEGHKPLPNLIMSPVSISGAMAMVKLATNGNTTDEIRDALSFPVSNDTDKILVNGYSKIFSSFPKGNSSNGGYTLKLANRLYAENELEIKTEYEDELCQFGAGVEKLNFGDNMAAADTINTWVANVTNGTIDKLIAAGSLDANTKLVLVNGIYFKGLWKKPFNSSLTKKAPFYLDESERVEVDMMFQYASCHFAHLENLDAVAVTLPYQGERLSLVIVVPNNRTGLWLLEEKVAELDPSKIRPRMTKGWSLPVYLPKFKIESTLNLVPIFQKLVVHKIFNPKEADFGKMTEGTTDSSLFISKIVHKAFFEVNEEGSEASAVTGIEISAASIPPTIMADHPFLFQVVDDETDLILFTGSYTGPQKSDDS